MGLIRSPFGRALVAATIACVVLVAIAVARRGDEVLSVSTAWSRPTPPGVDVTAVYFDVRGGSTDDTLTGVRVDPTVAGRATVHRNVTDEAGRTAMAAADGVAADGVAVAAGATVAFEPVSELHVMVEQLVAPLVDGDRFELVVVFAGAGEITVDVEVTTTPS